MSTSFAAAWMGTPEMQQAQMLADEARMAAAPAPASEPEVANVAHESGEFPVATEAPLTGNALLVALEERAPRSSFAYRFASDVLARGYRNPTPRQEALAQRLWGELNGTLPPRFPARPAPAPSTSVYVGTVGRSATFVLTVQKALEFAGRFGVTTMHLFTDPQGNVFKWSTSARKLREGATYAVTGTIKAHAEYRDTKQTVLTRCTAVEV